MGSAVHRKSHLASGEVAVEREDLPPQRPAPRLRDLRKAGENARWTTRHEGNGHFGSIRPLQRQARAPAIDAAIEVKPERELAGRHRGVHRRLCGHDNCMREHDTGHERNGRCLYAERGRECPSGVAGL